VRVIITLRADFYDRPLLHPDFSQLMRQQTEVVVPLTAEELAQAIAAPAERVGVTFEPDLVTRIVAEVNQQPGALPLLQYALTELFERRADHLLTKKAYQSIGGVSGALARRAEEVYAGLDEAGQAAVRQLFLRLVALGEGVEDTRRRVLRAEVEALTSGATGDGRPETGLENPVPSPRSPVVDSKAIAEVIEAFGRWRLLSFDRDPLTREPTVEVAHEALLREWGRLREWLDASRADVRLQRLLAVAAAEWIAANRDLSFLLHGGRLAQFEGWAAGSVVALTQDERAFLEASIAERQVRQAEEEARQRRELEAAQQLAEAERQRAETQARAAQALRRRAVFLAGALLIAGILAVVAVLFGQQASRNARQAQHDAQIALAREWAAAAISNLDVDPERSVLLALQAVSVTYNEDGTVIREAENALHRAVPSLRTLLSLPGHASSVYDMALSPDGTRMATASIDGTAKIWNITPGPTQGEERELLALTGHTDWLWGVAFSPDGTRLATASRDGTAKVWDAATGRELFTLSGHSGEVYDVVFSPDGTRLATASADGTVKMWGVTAPTRSKLLFTLAYTGYASVVAFSPDGAFLAIAGEGGAAAVWNLTAITLASPDSPISAQEAVLTLCCHSTDIIDITFSPECGSPPEAAVEDSPQEGEQCSLRLATASNDKTAKLWDAATGRELLTLYGHTGPVNVVTFNADGTRLVTQSGDGLVKIWAVPPGATGGQELLTIPGISGYGDLTSDGASLITVKEGGSVTVSDIAPSRELLTLSGHTDWVWGVAFSPDGTRIATAGFDQTAKVWDISTALREASLGDNAGATTGQVLFTLPEGAHTDWVNTVAFSPDGTRLATASNDATAKVWDLTTGRELFTLTGHTYTEDGFPYQGVGHVVFSPDGTRLATSGGDGTARLWDAMTGQELLTLSAHSQVVTGVAFDASGARLATVSFDGTAKVWDVSDGPSRGQVLFTLTLEGQERGLWSFAFSPDGTRLAITQRDGTVISIWDASPEGSREQPLQTLIGHTSIDTGAAFSPDGTRLATASFDGTAKVWDVATGEELLTLTGHNGGVTSVAFSPDGKRLVTGSQDGTARVYVLPIEELMALARSRLTRSFTLEECQRFLHMEQCP
jgi:WD40 repeat protein